MRRLLSYTLTVLVLVCGFATAASAQQSISLSLGGFTPRALDARGSDDVLFRNNAFFTTSNRDRGIDITKFNGFTISGEYLVGVGRNLEAGLGLGFYQRSQPLFDADFVNSNGSEIIQDTKLRIIPFTATVRFLPTGTDSGFQPYIGAGVGVFRWRYSETGDFVDSRNNIFSGNFVASGAEAGPVVLGGVKFPIGAAAVGGEIRWQGARATLPADQFLGTKVDLGGVNYLFTVNFRF